MLLSAVIWREQVIMLGNVRWKASPDGTSVLLPVFYLPFPSIRPLSCFNMHIFEPWEENLEKSQTNSKNMQNPHRKSFSLTWEMNPGLSGFCCKAPSCHFNIQNLNMNEDVMMFWYLQYILGREHTVDIQQTKVKLVFHSRVSSENAQPWYEQRFSSRLQSCKGSMLSSYNGASLNLPRGCLATAPHLHLQEVRRSPLPPLSHRQAFHVPLSLSFPPESQSSLLCCPPLEMLPSCYGNVWNTFPSVLVLCSTSPSSLMLLYFGIDHLKCKCKEVAFQLPAWGHVRGDFESDIWSGKMRMRKNKKKRNF